tara:strand:+ start:2241 stop:2528 length:288 start_codon:yes stop_codon:yes gene_type:complete
MFYDKYKKEIEAAGYTLTDGQVYDHMGNQCAGEDRFGQAWSKDVNLDAMIAEIESKPKKKVAKKVRARDAKGKLKADDPSTPDVNEAWTTVEVDE